MLITWVVAFAVVYGCAHAHARLHRRHFLLFASHSLFASSSGRCLLAAMAAPAPRVAKAATAAKAGSSATASGAKAAPTLPQLPVPRAVKRELEEPEDSRSFVSKFRGTH